MRSDMKTAIRVTALAAVGLIVTACGAQQEASKQTGTPATVPTSASPSIDITHAPPAEDETTPPPEDPAVAKIGAAQWFTYEDGLKIQVTKAVRSGATVVVTITIRNGAQKTVDLAATSVYLTYGANGNTAEQDYSANTGFGYPGFTGSVTPGRAKTARFAFVVPKNQVIDVEVAPGFLDYESCHFEGSVK